MCIYVNVYIVHVNRPCQKRCSAPAIAEPVHSEGECQIRREANADIPLVSRWKRRIFLAQLALWRLNQLSDKEFFFVISVSLVAGSV